jgi:chromosomal replication initiation ATPase DnaA
MANVNDPRVIIRKADRIAYILSGICDYYNVGIEDFKKYVRRPERLNRKRIAMQILYDIGDCHLKDIAYAMGYDEKSLPTIHGHISTLRDDISKHTIGNKELKTEYKNVLNYLKL